MKLEKKHYIWALVVILLLIAFAYQMKWFGNTSGFFAAGGRVPSNPTPPSPAPRPAPIPVVIDNTNLRPNPNNPCGPGLVTTKPKDGICVPPDNSGTWNYVEHTPYPGTTLSYCCWRKKPI